MDTVSFTAGLALGLKRGGSQGENIVQYIVDNSVYVDTVPINDTYHCEMRLMFVDNRGISWTYSPKAAGKIAKEMQGRINTFQSTYQGDIYQKSVEDMCAIVQWLVMYEDNAPIYAKSAYLSWPMYNSTNSGTRTIDGVTQPIYIWATIYDVDFDNITKGYNSLTFYKSTENYSQGKIYTDTGSTSIYVTAPRIAYYYDVAHDEYGDYPRQNGGYTSTLSFYLPDNISPTMTNNLLYTCLSPSALQQKYNEILAAINEDIYNVQTNELVIMPPPQPT